MFWSPVIDVILAPVLFVDGPIVVAIHHPVNPQDVRLVCGHCSLRLDDHSWAPWHERHLISTSGKVRKMWKWGKKLKEVLLLRVVCGVVEYSRTAEKSWLIPPNRPDDWSEPIWTPESREVVQGCVCRHPGGGGWGGGTGCGAAQRSSKPNTNPTLRSCIWSALTFQVGSSVLRPGQIRAFTQRCDV